MESKNFYKKPSIEIIEIESQGILCSSVTIGGGDGGGVGGSVDPGEDGEENGSIW